MTTIYHNPRCRKSRETLELLKSKDINPDIRLYLEDPPTKKELKDILKLLGISASELIRKNEAIFKEKYKGKEMDEESYLQAMTEHPKLIERPIVIHKSKASLGRPPEQVLSLF